MIDIRSNIRPIGLLASAGFVALTLAAGHASAQTAVPASEPKLDAIVVTANRRAENLQKVPIAITVVTASSLQKGGALRTSDLSTAIPGLTFNVQLNNATPFIRGVGTTNGAVGTESSVALYIDDVYISSSNAAIFQFNNVESIAALKGPQGTLFGRNATGGVIQVRTRDPSQKERLDVTGTFANYSTKEGALYFNTPVTDNLAVNVAAYGRKQSDGWGRNLTTGDPTYAGWDWGVRVKALWTPSANTTVLLSADTNDGKSQRGLFRAVLPQAGGYYDTQSSPNDFAQSRQIGASLKVTQDLGVAKLVSITSYRNTKGFLQVDQDTTPVKIVDLHFGQRDKETTQELQLLAPKESRIQWIVGAFYFHDYAAYAPFSLSGLAVPAVFSSIETQTAQKTNSYSGYAQATAEVLPRTHLTLGARYTSDSRSVTGRQDGLLANGMALNLTPSTTQSKTWRQLTWRASVDHQFNDDLLGYVSYNRGFKSGVYNIAFFTQAPVNPEKLDAIEVGLKSELWDHRIRTNIAAFYYSYKDIQVQEILAGQSVSINAAKATIKGMDFDITAQPTDHLQLRVGGAYLDGHYDKFPNGPYYAPAPATCGPPITLLPGPRTGPNIVCSTDLSGYRTQRSPKWTLNLSGDYTIPASFGTIVLNGTFYYNAGFFWGPDNRAAQNAFRTVNASIQLVSLDKTWDVSVWGRNLAGEKYCEFVASQTFGDACAPAAPRTYGVTVGAHF